MSSSTSALPSSPKKRKRFSAEDPGPSTKKPKKERKHKRKHAHVDEEFILVKASLVVSIPPVFASNPSQGAEEMLDSMVMRYIPTLRGVVLTHSNLYFPQPTAQIQGDSPYAICKIRFDATVWSPRVGQRLIGKVNLCSPDHVSLLVHHTFNVSIPRQQIPLTEWAFEYGPAENDPDNAAESGGRWVHALTGLPLGGDDATLEFTVIGLTIANQMLSLVGSIQTDPLALEHAGPAPVGPAHGNVQAPPNDPEGVIDDANAVDDSSEPENVLAELKRTSGQNETEGANRKGAGKAEKKEDHGENKKKRNVDEKEHKRRKKKVKDDEERKPKKKKKLEDE